MVASCIARNGVRPSGFCLNGRLPHATRFPNIRQLVAPAKTLNHTHPPAADRRAFHTARSDGRAAGAVYQVQCHPRPAVDASVVSPKLPYSERPSQGIDSRTRSRRTASGCGCWARDIPLDPMGLQAMGLPDALHGRRADVLSLRHGSNTPVCGCGRLAVQRRLHDGFHLAGVDDTRAPGPRGIVQKSLHVSLAEGDLARFPSSPVSK